MFLINREKKNRQSFTKEKKQEVTDYFQLADLKQNRDITITNLF